MATTNVNIYDFIEYETAVYTDANNALKPPNYPSVEVLAIYSWTTGKVYSLDAALASGTMILLLESIGRFFSLSSISRYMDSMVGKKELNSVEKRVVVAVHNFFYSKSDGKWEIMRKKKLRFDEVNVEKYVEKWKAVFELAECGRNFP